MKTTTYEATVLNGQIKLPDIIHIPDHTKVFVVVPQTKENFTVVTGYPDNERHHHFAAHQGY